MRDMRIGTWFKGAPAGERFVYGIDDGNDRPQAGEMKAARHLADQGLVLLFQRREHDGSLSYVAQRTRREGALPTAKVPTRPLVMCQTPGCDRLPPVNTKIGLCRQCQINAARRRRRGAA